MVVMSEIMAAVGIDAVNHSGFEIGDEELLMPTVIGDIAECGSAIGPAVESDFGKFLGLISVVHVEPVDRPRPGIRTPHAVHPIALISGALDPMKSEGGRRG